MTTLQRDGIPATAFSRWIRNEPRLDSIRYDLGVNDCDYWIHRYLSRRERKPGILVLDLIMLIEVKAFNADPRYSQRDTLEVVNELLRKACLGKNGRRRPAKIKDTRDSRPHPYRYVKCFGVHLLQMSGSDPESSDHLFWDHREINLGLLIELLLFERDPDHPGKIQDSRRHHKTPDRELPLPLLQRIK